MRKRKLLLFAFLFIFTFTFLCPAPAQAKTATTYTIYVNRKTNIVNVVNSKTGKLVRAMYCSTGKNYGTIRGTYYTRAKYKWRPLIHGVYGQYSTRIYGGYLFHSVPYYQTKKNTVSTSAYNQLGRQASAGCIRLAVTDAKWIYDHCRLGTKVVIGESRTLKKPSRPLIKVSTKSRTGWDPTDPDSSNPYKPTLSLNKKGKKTIKYGSKFDITKLIKVKSSYASKKVLLKNVSVKGKVKTKKPGTYKVVCTVTDPYTTVSTSKTFTFKVGKKPKTATEKKDQTTESGKKEQTTSSKQAKK